MNKSQVIALLLGTAACAESSSSSLKGNVGVEYMGCFNRMTEFPAYGNNRYFRHQDPFKYVGYDASPEECRKLMIEGGYRFGGFQYIYKNHNRGHCWATNTYPLSFASLPADRNKCDIPCSEWPFREFCTDHLCVDYRGNQNMTKTGKTCQAWHSNSPHEHSRKKESYPTTGLDRNYCRNPDGEKTIWCYTTDPNTRTEECDVIPEQGYKVWLQPPFDSNGVQKEYNTVIAGKTHEPANAIDSVIDNWFALDLTTPVNHNGYWQADFKEKGSQVKSVQINTSRWGAEANGAKIYIGNTLCGTMPQNVQDGTFYEFECQSVGDYVRVVTGRPDGALSFSEITVVKGSDFMCGGDGYVSIYENPSATSLKSMVKVNWDAASTDTMKENDLDIEHNFNQLANIGDHPDAQGEANELQQKLNELAGKLQPSMNAWAQSPEAQALAAKGQKFFDTRVNTAENKAIDERAERRMNALAGGIAQDSSPYDETARGQTSRLEVRNDNIFNATKSEIEIKGAQEKAWNSQEGQDVMGAVKATVENKQARDFGDAVEAGLKDMSDADPARRARLEERIQRRAEALGRSIESQLNFMGKTAQVTDTEALQTPDAQKLFEEANKHIQINPAGWK